ncbi:MAG TPA: YbhB/YbcL family Raf kinase inhibitor-like protein [Desulfobacteraceae bacterium]|nr:YbhB/YbcL family Raf kinase inhibitor-like protein [Desulfobacteraceae bacterium]
MDAKSRQELTVTSSAFNEGSMIPIKYTLNSENISPDISWKGSPDGTKSFVIIMEDPDIPMPKFLIPSWIHWIVYDIPPGTTSIPAAIPITGTLDNGMKQGKTSFMKTGYKGPKPPFGTHRYFFNIYALDKTIDLSPVKANKKKIMKAMDGHVLAKGTLMGRYKKE